MRGVRGYLSESLRDGWVVYHTKMGWVGVT